MVRALQLVSIIVEVLGPQAQPVLGTIAEYLPKVIPFFPFQNTDQRKTPGYQDMFHAYTPNTLEFHTLFKYWQD